MDKRRENCTQCGTALTTDRQQARGVCGSCKRGRVEK